MRDAGGVMFLRVQAAVAAHESANKSRRARRKMIELAEAGMPRGGSTRPFGYEADGLALRPAEAAIVRDLASRLLAGESLASLTPGSTTRRS